MYRVIAAEKVHASIIVSTLNRKAHDFAVYKKHKRTLSEIDSEINTWRCILDNSNQPAAFAKIISNNQINRVIEYSIIFTNNDDHRQCIADFVRYLFNKYNVQKVTTDVVYDRSDIIKAFISMGAAIDVRKRHHITVAGSPHHVVEISILDNEFKYERPKG